MSAAGKGLLTDAARLRAHARRGVWRRVLSWLGVTAHTRQADARAARMVQGARGEVATGRLLDGLAAQGWYVLHGRSIPGRKHDLDHVLIAPDATFVAVLDSKQWHAQRSTRIVDGRVHCGGQDRHGQVDKVAVYADRVAAVLGIPAERVVPLLVVHGSPVHGGALTVRAGRRARVHVLSPDWLLSTLSASARARDPQAAARLAARVAAALPAYQQR